MKSHSLRKQPTSRDVTTGYLDLGSASDWSCRQRNLLQPIKSTNQIWGVTRHQYGISAVVSQSSF